MKKLAACLLAVCLLGCSGLTVGAAQLEESSSSGSVAITTQVPASHTLTVQGEQVEVSCDGTAGDSFSVGRLSQPELVIRPVQGYRVTGVTLNGEDITSQIREGVYLLPPVYQDLVLVVTTETDPSATQDTPSEPTSQTPSQPSGQSPQTGEEGNLLPVVVLLLASGGGGVLLWVCRKKLK